jgi:inorganic pyrophosphatase
MNKIVTVQIEIGMGQSVKYEINHHTNQIICDRFLYGPFLYPFNYGYIINTLGGDGDPLDAVVICKPSLQVGCFINCRIIGALITTDENGRDEKILLVPDDKIDPYSVNIKEYSDIDSHTINEIKYFFEHYKDMEANKHVKVENFISSDEATKIYEQSIVSK